MTKPLTPAQIDTLWAIAAGAVTRNRWWMVFGARSDVLGRLEERGLIGWDGPEPGHRRGDRAHGLVTLTDAGRDALAETNIDAAAPAS